MFRLSRAVRFAINPGADPGPAGPAINGYAGSPSIRGLGRHYELIIECQGDPDPLTGMVADISRIDAAVRAAAVPIIARACAEHPETDPRSLLPALLAATSRALDLPAASLAWKLTPTHSISIEKTDMSRVTLRQKLEFAASHRLHCDALSPERNREVFGKCNNEWGHGHNYVIEPAVSAPLDPAAAPFTLADLERITAQTIIRRFDHKHLNNDTPEFGPRGIIPTVENISRVCFDLLAPAVASAGASLSRVTVWETEKTSCVYPA
jgi:6-pyruvoyltetrahydropterin/6-carboxytetrahydropterin synthase